MKKNWEIVRLGDLCESDLGKTLNKSHDTGNFHPYLCSINVLWDKIDLSTLKEARFNENEIEKYSVQKGDLLICEGGDIGRCAIWEKEESFLYQNAIHRVRFNDRINPRYCLYYLKHLKDTGTLDSRYGKGVTIKHLVKSSLHSIPIPVPPLPVQARIVDELDCLQGILSKKRQQLAEYHSLAQAIFHQMFGDPVVNEKGWEVKRLGEVCELKAGKNIKASDLKKSHIEGTYPCYGGNDIRGYINRYSHIENHIIIGRQGALCGNVVYACAPFYATEHAVVVTIKQTMQELWLFYTLKYLNLNQYAKGVAQPGLAVGTLNKVFIPIPPSHLQEEFISYVNIIHNQCERLALSIHETEDLLACRMETLLACRMETLLNCPQA